MNNNIFQKGLHLLRRVWQRILHFEVSPNGPVTLAPGQRRGFSRRLALPIVLILFMLICILYRLVHIQIVDHQKHLAQAQRILGFNQRLLGARGCIYDRNGVLLVGNRQTRDLYTTPRLVQEKSPKQMEEYVNFLVSITHLPKSEVQQKLNRGLYNSVLIKKEIDQASTKCLEALHLPGVSVKWNEKTGYGSLYLKPHVLTTPEELKQVCARLEKSLNYPEGDIEAIVAKGRRRKIAVQMLKKISTEDATKIQEAFQKWNRLGAKGKKRRVPSDSIHFEDSFVRYYTQNRSLSNVLGYCDVNGVGVSGIENMLQAELKERTGIRPLPLDGNISANNYPAVVMEPAMDGQKVYLTIDGVIQQIVEKNLQDLVAEHAPKRAYAVMADPHTGAILAVAQYPNFNPNEHKLQPGDERELHALLTVYEPGSIMKGISVSSAMDYANLPITKIIDCEGGRYAYGGGKPMREHGNIKMYDTPIWEIIQKSSNIGSAKLVVDYLGAKTYYQYLRAFGFGMKTRPGFYPENGTPRYFPLESSGILRPVEKWNKSDIPRIAIGHSVSVTPLQMVQAYCALANNGVMMQLHIVDHLVAPDNTRTNAEPLVRSTPLRPVSAMKIIQCLKLVTQKGGTATSAAVKGYPVAGKTGTAIKVDPVTKQYNTKLNTASFVGFVPADNPAFVLLITADEPSGKMQFGGSVCGKTFSKIALETLKLMQIPPVESTENRGKTMPPAGKKATNVGKRR